MNNLITVFENKTEVKNLNDRQIIYIRSEKRLYMYDLTHCIFCDSEVNSDGTCKCERICDCINCDGFCHTRLVGRHLIDLLREIDLNLAAPMRYSTAVPDYENMSDIDQFTNGTSYTADENGFVLITAKGLRGFEIRMGSETRKKVLFKKDDIGVNNTNLEILFSNALQSKKGKIREIEEFENNRFEKNIYTCHFIPNDIMFLREFDIRNEKRYWEVIYPVGSIYMSVVNLGLDRLRRNTPEQLFGGKWSRFSEGRVLIGHGTTKDDNGEERTFNSPHNRNFPNNWQLTEGGAYQHQLTIPEMPEHKHEIIEHSTHKNHEDYRYHTHTIAASTRNINSVTNPGTGGWEQNISVLIPNNTQPPPITNIATDRMFRGNTPDTGQQINFDGKWDEINAISSDPGVVNRQADYSHNEHERHNMQTTGETQFHNNIQPHVVVFMWVREE